jgi:periodic tryptophan protein 1
MVWDPFQPNHLYTSLENGQIVCLDIRNIQHVKDHSAQVNPYFAFQAHEKTVSSLNFSASIKGLLATASLDQTVKLWDVNSLQSAEPHQLMTNGSKQMKSSSSSNSLAPKCVAYKSMNVGKLFTLRFSYDDTFVLATAGDEGKVAVWESDEMEIIKNHFQDSIYEVNNPYLHLKQ